MIIERAPVHEADQAQAKETESIETRGSERALALDKLVVCSEQLAVARRLDPSQIKHPSNFNSAVDTLSAMSSVNWAAQNPQKLEKAFDYWMSKDVIDQLFPSPVRSNQASQKASKNSNPEDLGIMRQQEKRAFVNAINEHKQKVAAHKQHLRALKREVVAFYDNPPKWMEEINNEAKSILEEEFKGIDDQSSNSGYTVKQKVAQAFLSINLLFSPVAGARNTETDNVYQQEYFDSESEYLRQEDSELFSIEKISITPSDAEKIIGNTKPMDDAPIIQELNIEGDLVFESQDFQAKIDYANGWVRDLRAEGHVVSLKVIYDYTKNGGNPKEAGVVISIDGDFLWGDVEVKNGGYALVGEENSLHFINPTSELPNTSVSIIKLDQETIDNLKETYIRLGYGELNTPAPGSWIAVETDEAGNIVQVITEEFAYFLIRTHFNGTSNVNVRSQPTTNSNIIQTGVSSNTEIVTPTAVPVEQRFEGEREENGLLFVSADGYTWTRVITDAGIPGFVAYEVINVGISKEAAGPKIKDELLFKTIEEVNYIDSETDPHLAYGITEEEYRDTKETVENLIPTEFRSLVLEQADGYSHEHRAFVKKENGEISYWRPGMGHELEDGWVQVLDKVQLPESLGSAWLYLEGNKKQLQERENFNMHDLSQARLEYDLFSELSDKLARNIRFSVKNNPIFIQIGAFNDTDVYKPTIAGNSVYTGYKLDDNGTFYQGRVLYTLPKEWGIETAKSALSENLILVLIGVYLNERGDFIRNSSRTTRLPMKVDAIMRTVLGEDYPPSYMRTADDIVREQFIVTLP